MRWLPLVVMAGLMSVPAAAGQFVILTPEPRDPALTHELLARPEVAALAAEQEAFRRRLLRWKEADFRRLFGEPEKLTRTADVRSVAERLECHWPQLVPDHGRPHIDMFGTSEPIRLLVSFGSDGVSPSYVGFFVRPDDGFVPVDRPEALGPRVSWERAALRRLARHVEARWRATVGWQVDHDAAAVLASGSESPHLPTKLTALRRQANWDGLHENMSIARLWCFQSEPNSRGRLKAYVLYVRDERPGEWYWTDGDSSLVQLHTRRWGSGPTDWDWGLEANTAEGVCRWDESGVPGHVKLRRFNRPDGSKLRYEGYECDGGVYVGACWSWYRPDGRAIRTERDTNGDGLPDEVSDHAAFHEKAPARRLAVEQSWAIRPELVPAEFRVPDQPMRRLPVRRCP